MALRDRSPPRDEGSTLPEMRASLQHSIGLIARNEESASNSKSLTGPSIATLTVVAMKYIEVMSSDLRAFSKHAKRAGITCDDVKLLARKVPELAHQLEQFERVNLTKESRSAHATKKRRANPETKKSSEDSSTRYTCNPFEVRLLACFPPMPLKYFLLLRLPSEDQALLVDDPEMEAPGRYEAADTGNDEADDFDDEQYDDF
mmetsp:Transcript_45078/g.76603  ORF Transcript_45078/g.76603 Transcript_45078/m.76603 type:complete len:203 (-) Transcript_45078:517-1125(-)